MKRSQLICCLVIAVALGASSANAACIHEIPFPIDPFTGTGPSFSERAIANMKYLQCSDTIADEATCGAMSTYSAWHAGAECYEIRLCDVCPYEDSIIAHQQLFPSSTYTNRLFCVDRVAFADDYHNNRAAVTHQPFLGDWGHLFTNRYVTPHTVGGICKLWEDDALQSGLQWTYDAATDSFTGRMHALAIGPLVDYEPACDNFAYPSVASFNSGVINVLTWPNGVGVLPPVIVSIARADPLVPCVAEPPIDLCGPNFPQPDFCGRGACLGTGVLSCNPATGMESSTCVEGTTTAVLDSDPLDFSDPDCDGLVQEDVCNGNGYPQDKTCSSGRTLLCHFDKRKGIFKNKCVPDNRVGRHIPKHSTDYLGGCCACDAGIGPFGVCDVCDNTSACPSGDAPGTNGFGCDCEAYEGACALNENTLCAVMTAADCFSVDGDYWGDRTVCPAV